MSSFVSCFDSIHWDLKGFVSYLLSTETPFSLLAIAKIHCVVLCTFKAFCVIRAQDVKRCCMLTSSASKWTG